MCSSDLPAGPRPQESVAFTDDVKWQLAIRAAAAETGADEASVAAGVAGVLALLPRLRGRGGSLTQGVLARLAADVDGLAERLVGIKAVLPRVDVEEAAAAWPALLFLEPGDVAARLSAAADILEGCADVQGVVGRCPRVLDTGFLRHSARELTRLWGDGRPVGALVEGSPGLLLLAEDMNKEPRNDYDDLVEESGRVNRGAAGD